MRIRSTRKCARICRQLHSYPVLHAIHCSAFRSGVHFTRCRNLDQIETPWALIQVLICRSECASFDCFQKGRGKNLSCLHIIVVKNKKFPHTNYWRCNESVHEMFFFLLCSVAILGCCRLKRIKANFSASEP